MYGSGTAAAGSDEEDETMANFTEAQIAALRAAIAAGMRRVTYDGKTVEYASLKEMREALEMMEADVNGRPTRRALAAFANGT